MNFSDLLYQHLNITIVFAFNNNYEHTIILVVISFFKCVLNIYYSQLLINVFYLKIIINGNK